MKAGRNPALCLLAAVLACTAPLTQAETVIVRAGRLLDVDAGHYLKDQAIRIEDDRVVSITRYGATPNIAAPLSSSGVRDAGVIQERRLIVTGSSP